MILVGHDAGGLGVPDTVDGRAAEATGEVALDETLGVDVGETVTVGGAPFTVVGTTRDTTLLAGVPLVFMTTTDAQDLVFRSRDVISAVLVDGANPTVPEGMVLLTVDEIGDDTLRPLDGAIASIDLVRVLLWIVAAVIIGSVVYLSALERQRDFAVLKAIGTSNRTLLGSLALQAVLVALAAVALAAVIQVFLAPAFPLEGARAVPRLLATAAAGGDRGADRRRRRDASSGPCRSGCRVRGGGLMSDLQRP